LTKKYAAWPYVPTPLPWKVKEDKMGTEEIQRQQKVEMGVEKETGMEGKKKGWGKHGKGGKGM